MPSAAENPPAARRGLVVAGIVVVIAAGAMLLNRFYTDSDFLPPDDFLQYWSAGRLHATGGNAYDADQLLPLQQAAGRPADKPAVVMWNPPWSLTLAMPFGILPPRTAQLFWLGLQVLALIICADRLWLVSGGPSKFRPWVWAAALGFYPTMYVLFAGQSGGWLLLGLTGLLLAATRGPVWLAAFIPFLALKPHLFVPVWLVLVLEAGRTRRGLSLFLWGLACGVAAVAIPTVVNPEVWSQYQAALSRPVDAAHSPLSGWRAPLIGWWVRMAVLPEAFWIQAVPTLLAMAAVSAYWWKRRRTWDWSRELPWLVLIGLIAAPYGGWPYDQMVLLVPVAAAAVRLVRSGTRRQIMVAGAAITLVNVIALTLREGEYFVWVPPAVLVWYAWVILAAHPGTVAERKADELGASAVRPVLPAHAEPAEAGHFATAPR